jgi:hypothetical protein
MLSSYVGAEALKSRVNTKFWNSVAELINKLLLPKLGSRCRIINTICWLLSTLTCSFAVPDCYLTKTLRSLGHPFLVTTDTTVLLNNKLTGQQN